MVAQSGQAGVQITDEMVAAALGELRGHGCDIDERAYDGESIARMVLEAALKAAPRRSISQL